MLGRRTHGHRRRRRRRGIEVVGRLDNGCHCLCSVVVNCGCCARIAPEYTRNELEQKQCKISSFVRIRNATRCAWSIRNALACARVVAAAPAHPISGRTERNFVVYSTKTSNHVEQRESSTYARTEACHDDEGTMIVQLHCGVPAGTSYK